MNQIICHLQLSRNNFEIDIKLNLPGSGVSALFGQSGSGKTSVLRFLAGLEPDAHGFIQVNENRWHDSETLFNLKTHKRRVGYVFQHAALFPHLTVLKNIEYGCKRSKVQDKNLSIENMIQLTGLEKLLQRYPGNLSGGEKQRVAIARALASNPELLLMDEPMASLDLQSKEQIIPYLEKLVSQLDIPVIYVSHSPDEVVKMAQYIAILENGKVKASGSVEHMAIQVNAPSISGAEVMIVPKSEWLRLSGKNCLVKT